VLDRIRRPKTTSVSSGMGGGMEPDAPPMSPATAGVGAARTSPAAAADGVFDGITVVEAAVAVSGSPAPLLADACC
jgi:hypothetical protein